MTGNQYAIRRIILILLVCFICNNIMAQKVNLDTLTINELNQYQHKAFKMRKSGIIVTLSGFGIIVASYVVGNHIANIPSDDPYQPNKNQWKGLTVGLLSGLTGMAAIVVGVPLYATGTSRYVKAEIALKKFDIKPENSMALGLGITLSF